MESTKDFVASGAKVVMDSHKFCSRPLASQTMSTTRLKLRNRRVLRLVFYSLRMAPSWARWATVVRNVHYSYTLRDI